MLSIITELLFIGLVSSGLVKDDLAVFLRSRERRRVPGVVIHTLIANQVLILYHVVAGQSHNPSRT